MHDVRQLKEKTSLLRILIVDDEELIRMLMKNFMDRLFGEVVTAEDGEDALEKWHTKGPFDVVLTDIRMPRMTGTQLIKELRDLERPPYIIVVSGAPEDAADHLIYSDVFMEKPLGFDQILEVLSQMIKDK